MLQHRGVGGGATLFPGLLHFTLEPVFIVLSAKQGSIKCHFLILWYDSTWGWTPVPGTIGEHSTDKANSLVSTKILENEFRNISYFIIYILFKLYDVKFLNFLWKNYWFDLVYFALL